MRIPLLTLIVTAVPLLAGSPEYYQHPTWKPRAILPTEDAVRGDFWPASPKADVNSDDPHFAKAKLSPAPAPGIYPRVLVTPTDVETIRAKVALGEKAPGTFRALWERTKLNRTAFYALVAQDNELGKSLAAALVAKVRALEPKLDKLDARPDRDNLWAVERSIVASGDPDPPSEIWALLDYDYLHGWMTPEERKETEQVIARLTKGRISNFIAYPDHFLINNHQGFGMEFLRLLMLIEGHKDFDAKVYQAAAKKARAMLDWYLSQDGMCYESIKGWLNISVYTALARRDPDFLKHSNLRAKMRFFQHALHWEDGRWQIREEMRASAFHVIWMMRYFHPEDPLLDWLYSATFTTHEFLTDAKAKWPDPVGITPELLLLFAEDGQRDQAGQPLDWTDQARINAQKLPLTWKDDQRGYVITRNSWDKDDLQLGFTCKQDFYYGGHEGSENNRIVLWADGVNWIRDSNMLAVKATFLQNMLTIDGKGLDWPPAPGVWLGVEEAPGGLLAAGDGKNGYDFSKVMQVHPLDFPSAQLPYYKPFAEGSYDLTRDHQIAFHPGTVKWNDGYAHTDYGPWSGETRVVESYKVHNPVEQAYRTVYLARGSHPYVLVLDDARKDANPHHYEWNATIPEGIDLLDSKTAEILFQSVPPGANRESDLLLGRAETPRDATTGRASIQKDDPLLLIRTLWRNSPYGFPVPRYEKMHVEPQAPYAGLGHVTIPAVSDSPEFRVLLYPHRHGDPLPVTSWNEDRTELTIRIGGATDVYRFGKTDGGRTVFSVERNGQPVLRSEAAPARPILEVRGATFDASAQRTTRKDGEVPNYPFDAEIAVKLLRPSAPAFLVYTLDGSEPTADSRRYEAPLRLENSAQLKARIIDPAWTAGPKEGGVLTADFTKVAAAAGLAAPPAGSQSGLLARVYEKQTVLWNDGGFFTADKIMLPDLDQEKPVTTTAVPDFVLPYVNPTRPVSEQAKGFYRFTGWFRAPARGVYEFAVDSCGPVRLMIAGQIPIASTGVFHQQQTVRRGDSVLDAGWHEIDLIICDPLLWNITSADEMPFSVTVRHNGGEAKGVATDDLRWKADGIPLASPPAMAWLKPGTPPAWLEPGADLATYERENKMRDPDYLDIDGQPALRTERTDRFESNLRPALVRVYDGWFHAPADGVYTFDLAARKAGRDNLSDLRGSFQNQLRIGEEIVVQRGVAGRRPTGQIGLAKGWYPFSLRLGASAAQGTVTYPDGQTLPLSAAELRRPVRVSLRPSSEESEASRYEIYGPTKITMNLPTDHKGVIRYTLDGSKPTGTSPEFRTDLTLSQSATVTAAAFLPDGSSTALHAADFRLVTVPEAGLIGSVRFDNWDGQTGATPLDSQSTVWISPGSKRENDGSLPALSVHRDKPPAERAAGVDVNVARAPVTAGLKLSGLKMRTNAITVGLWFKSDSADGKLFGKDGYSAFGKSYRTVSCALNKGRLQANPGRISGGEVKPGQWTHIVLAADGERSQLYLNGQPVASGEGSAALVTDALDFLSGHPASIAEIRIYERVLSDQDVAQWHQASMPPRKQP